MKKSAVFILFFLMSAGIFAQDLTSKDGESILPQAKDWSIGLDATKLIKNASFDFISTSQAITAKYFKDAKTAYRIGLRVGVNNWTTKEQVIDRLAATSTVVAFPASHTMKENKWNRFSTAVGLSFGIEKRRGNTRLQGIYGIEAGFYISSSKDKFTYGNALNPSQLVAPTVNDISDDAMTSSVLGNANNIDTVPNVQNTLNNSARVVNRKNGITLSIGARAFIGAEYFLLPKISLGGEFGWGLGFSMSGRSETTLESLGVGNTSGNANPIVGQTIIDGNASNHFRFDTDNASLLGGISASLRLNLYF